ncbi:unnamed protein product [Adineta ricciae]|uniref:Chitin-binding type-2 domain-containing protein n=1 Tax=Adineta ricciae TaxID=249248 RepID=A0A814U8W8_ADIRI|nr:unnamed protein product [Adineta ricciae]CAF1385733.1 unnamed protein product [Adineta ricciae]
MKQTFLLAIGLILVSPTINQILLTNVPFECRSKQDGFWRDLRYCDVIQVCVGGEQKRSYGCPQVGERFYFDEQTQRCEFAAKNTGGCQSNQYYTPITNATTPSGTQLSTPAPTEPWKIFARSQEQFNCAGRQDGFYASRWCNVFYRCYSGVSNAFLCPLQPGGARLWWVQHGSSQGLLDESVATCVYPCDTGRQCSSAGGIIVENGNQISESQQEAANVYRQSPCSNRTSSGSGAGQFGSGQTGSGQLGTGQTGTGQIGSGQTGTGQIGGGNQGSTGGTFTVDSDVSCAGKPDDTYLSSRYCNVFHRCVSGVRFDLRCPRANNIPYDLWWNQQTNLCDWPCRVQCTGQLYASSTAAQQVSSESLKFFNGDCRAYPLIFD